MDGYVLLLLCCMIDILLLIIYFAKRRIDLFENKIYISLIVCNFVCLLNEILCKLSASSLFLSAYSEIIVRFFCIFLLLWGVLLTIYNVIIVTNKIKSKKILLVNLVFFLILLMPLLFLNIDLVTYNDSYYVDGLAINYLVIVATIYIIFNLILVVCKYKEMGRKTYPVIIYMLLMVLVVIAHSIDPSSLLMNCFETFICLLMYFTIENPDVKMIEELEIAKNQADKANSAKTDFLSSMSHEIRTPLNAIVGFSNCIDEASSLDEAKENAKDIVSASTTLLEIVNGILDISKIEAGKLEIVNSSYDTYELFNGVAKMISAKMNEKALDFQVDIAPDLPKTLYGDHANIKKIVTNLLSNAYKYTDKGSVKYEVSCVNKDNICRLIIKVSDTGRGIKEENINKLFTKFQRLDEDRNTTIEGTGLGLAITKKLIELMGGNIVVSSVYGEGSTFTVSLDQRIENIKIVKESVNDSLDLTGKKILVVDDNMLNLKVADKLLSGYGANVESANSGFECLDKIKNGSIYDIILMDDMMPKMSGTETLMKLKEIVGFSMPVIALTANAITGMREKYLKNGFDDYLAKPIEKLEMIKTFNKVLGNTTSNTAISHNKNNPDIYNNIDFLDANGFDVKTGIELLGDINTYNEIMNEFLNNIDSLLTNLEIYKNNNDMKDYATVVHTIKSDCKYLGMNVLADMCLEHEKMSKENDVNYINDNYDILRQTIENNVIICKNYLGRD